MFEKVKVVLGEEVEGQVIKGITVVKAKEAEVEAEVKEKVDEVVTSIKRNVPWKPILIGFAIVVVLGVIVQSLVK